MTIGGPKGFERSYTLEGTAGERPNELDSRLPMDEFLDLATDWIGRLCTVDNFAAQGLSESDVQAPGHW